MTDVETAVQRLEEFRTVAVSDDTGPTGRLLLTARDALLDVSAALRDDPSDEALAVRLLAEVTIIEVTDALAKLGELAEERRRPSGVKRAVSKALGSAYDVGSAYRGLQR